MQKLTPFILYELLISLLFFTYSSPSISKSKLPIYLPETTDENQPIYVQTDEGLKQELTIIPQLQSYLTKFIHDRNNPVAAIVVIDIKTGEILAMVQGQDPKTWGADIHTALYTGFPAASLFKTVVAAAGFEVADLNEEQTFGLLGGCGDVRPEGVWLHTKEGRRNNIDLRRAYGSSCNGFFAKIAVNYLGLGSIKYFAEKFGWGKPLDVDFYLPDSPILFPDAAASSVYTVGRFAAGFGYVGINAIHAAWMSLVVANNGKSKKIRIFKQRPPLQISNEQDNNKEQEIINPLTAAKLRAIMDKTVRGGTASYAFRRGKYKKIRSLVGGKTGTLRTIHPKGLTTWFTGIMPMENPEIAVASVVVLTEDLWYAKGPNLAAEAFWAYHDFKQKQENLAAKLSTEFREQ